MWKMKVETDGVERRHIKYEIFRFQKERLREADRERKIVQLKVKNRNRSERRRKKAGLALGNA